MNRIELPTNEDFGLSPVTLLQDPASYNVQVPLVGLSDDELRHQAETESNWDLYTTHEIDIPNLSLTAVKNRFRDRYRGDPMDEPGAFIDAILDMQRTLPNAREYAALLARQGLVRPREAQIVPQTAYDLDVQTDDGSDAARAYYKVYYLANATVPETRTAKDASEFASDSIQLQGKQLQGKYSDKLAAKRQKRLLEARGVDRETVEAAEAGELGNPQSARQAVQLAKLGLSRVQLEKLVNAPFDHQLLQRYKSAPFLAEHVLSDGTLDRQIAVRQFFGTENLTDLLTNQVELERSIKDNNAGYSSYFINTGLARSLMGSLKTKDVTLDDYVSNFNARFETAVPIGANLPRLGGLALFAAHEKAIVGKAYRGDDVLSHHVESMVMSDYRRYLDLKLAAEKRLAE